MSDDFKTRMRQAGKKPSTLRVSSPEPKPTSGTNSTADAALFFSLPGTTTSRPMTEEERQSILQGRSPTVSYSDAEKRELLKMGWAEGDPVPPDIAATFAKVVEEYQAKEFANRGVPKGELIVKDINDLPPHEQEKARRSIQESIAQLKENSAGTVTFSADVMGQVRDFFSDKEVVIPDWPGSSTSASAEPAVAAEAVQSAAKKEEKVAEETAPSQRETSVGKRCVHCGGDPFEDLMKSPISKADKHDYLLAIGTGKSFEKEYTVFNDTITVRFRALRPGEKEHLRAWAGEKAQEETKKHAVDFKTFVEIMRRYEVAASVVLQTTYLKSNFVSSSLFWAAPEGNRPWLKDWIGKYGSMTFDELLDRFYDAVGSDAVIAALEGRLGLFLLLDHRLTNNAADTENFWQGI